LTGAASACESDAMIRTLSLVIVLATVAAAGMPMEKHEGAEGEHEHKM